MTPFHLFCMILFVGMVNSVVSGILVYHVMKGAGH